VTPLALSAYWSIHGALDNNNNNKNRKFKAFGQTHDAKIWQKKA